MPPPTDIGSAPIERASGTATFGMAVFLASDLMLFAAFFAAYFVLRGVAETWPPPDVELDMARTGTATGVLVASSFTLIAGERALERRQDRAGSRRWLLLTMGLGAAFLANQLLEYGGLGFLPSSHPYGSVFWLLTGLHGVHVLAGIAAMGMLYVRLVRAGPERGLEPWVKPVSLYWHLVDAVWVGVFVTVWVLR